MKRQRTFLLILLVMLTVSLVPPASAPVNAHPADMYLHNHVLTLTPEQISLRWSLIPGTLLGAALYRSTDANGNGTIDEAEALTWVEPYLPDLNATVDGTPVTWTLGAVTWPEASIDLELGIDGIHVDLTAPWPAGYDGEHTIALINTIEPDISTSWFVVQAEGEIGFLQPSQDGSTLKFSTVEETASNTEESTVWHYWDSGIPIIPGGVAPQDVTASRLPSANTGATAELTRIVTEGARSPWFYLGALLTAAVLGILHALTPGHGKALVGAYLVGSRGTPRHAIILGAIVTVTHTGSVLAFGLIILAASRFVMPNTLFPVLELASGLLILALGVMLLRNRWRGLRGFLARQAAAGQTLPQDTVLSGAIEAAQRSTTTQPAKTRIAINQPIAVGGYGDVFKPAPVKVTGAPSGSASAAAAVNWRSLIALGVSGGMVPCPDAIAILLVAVAINRVILGLSLIMTFSLGMAFVLIAIGLMIVRGQRLLGRRGGDLMTRYAPAIAVMSAVVVLFLGGYLTANAVSRTGWLDNNGDDPGTIVFDREAAFNADDADLLFLANDDNGRQQLYRQAMDDPTMQPLTAAEFGIWGYALGPDGDTVVYALREGDRSSSLWRLDLSSDDDPTLLVLCEGAFCSELVWAPDGNSLLYEHLDLESGNNSLWTLDPASGDTAPAFQDRNLPAFAARYAPDGSWLSYISPNTNGIQLYNLRDGDSFTIASGNGQPVMWEPDGTSLVFVDLPVDGSSYTPRLKRYTIETGAINDISGDAANQDMLGAFAPENAADGPWLALVRAQPDENGTVRGNQIVLVRPDGNDSRALTTEKNYIYGEPVWSPDGTYLLVHRYPLAVANARPEVVRIAITSGAVTIAIPRGHNPSWMR